MSTDEKHSTGMSEQVPSTSGGRFAFVAECQALEQRWVTLNQEIVGLTPAWQQLLDAVSRGRTAQAQGQVLSWTEGAVLFSELGKQAALLSALTSEALQTCRRYTQTLDHALEEYAPAADSQPVVSRARPNQPGQRQ